MLDPPANQMCAHASPQAGEGRAAPTSRGCGGCRSFEAYANSCGLPPAQVMQRRVNAPIVADIDGQAADRNLMERIIRRPRFPARAPDQVGVDAIGAVANSHPSVS